MNIVGTDKISSDLNITKQTARRWLKNGRFGDTLEVISQKKRRSLFIFHDQLIRFKVKKGMAITPYEVSLVNSHSNFSSSPIVGDAKRLVGQVEPGQPIL